MTLNGVMAISVLFHRIR